MTFKPNYYKGPPSDHFDEACFYNPWNPRHHSFKALLRWKIHSEPKPWPKHVENQFSDVPPLHVAGDEIRVSFVGQSTLLIQTQGVNILTDPIWSEWAAPIKLSRTKRVSKPGIDFDKLPKIEIVLLTHNHYDHFDRQTIQKLWKRDQPLFLTPLGNDTIIHSWNSNIKVEALDWDESRKLNDITFHLLPSQHWSARGFFDKDKALWGAFVIETKGGNIYFAGDTGYGNGDLFRKAKATFGSFRFAALPVGAYEPRWFMSYAHMNPEEAVLAHQDLGQPLTLGIHLQTFRLTDEAYDDPIKDLAAARTLHSVPENKFRTLKTGETWLIP